MARLSFEARITVRALHPNRFDMCSPAPSKRVFHEPLEAEDDQPDAERRDGCCAKCEGDHHPDHMNLPAYSWRTLPHRAGAWPSNFKLTHYPSRLIVSSRMHSLGNPAERPYPRGGVPLRLVRSRDRRSAPQYDCNGSRVS